MPATPADYLGGKNVAAFLDMLAFSELGPQLIAASDNGYNVLVGATPAKPLLFADYSKHPAIYNKATNSTAAGRYQFLSKYWDHYRARLHLPDFGPVSQDRWAIQLITECKAFDDVKAGRLLTAAQKCRSRWASLPGAGYGQHEHTMADLQAAYLRAGGGMA